MAHLARVVVASSEEVLAFHLLAMVAKSVTTGGKVCIILSEVLLSRKGEGGTLPEGLLFQGRA
jgi:hypothetical protein